MRFNTLLAAIGVASLAACGGSSTGSSHATSFNALKNDFGDIGELLDSSAPTAASQVPTSGSASYSGVVSVFEANAGPAIDAATFTYATLGEMNVNANFSNGRVTGRADNFYEFQDPNVMTINGARSGGRVNGNLTLNGNLNRGLLEGTLDGNLTRANGAVSRYDMDVEGVLVGNRAEAIIGLAEGTSVTNGNRKNAGAVFAAQ